MTEDQAKEILKLYRPGTADAGDPSFAEALAFCDRDAQLKKWFGEHCALYSAFRAKFKQIAVPEGLKEQIIAERPIQRAPVWQKAVVLAGAVAAVITIVSTLNQWHHTSDPTDFASYRNRMIGEAARGPYGMDDRSADLGQIRAFLAANNTIADYSIPDNLQKNAKAAGCAVKAWRGKRVSMLCFASGRPLAPGEESDVWLFVTDRDAVTDAPGSATPRIEKVNSDGLIAASWTVGNRIYVLATKGDEQFLNRFL